MQASPSILIEMEELQHENSHYEYAPRCHHALRHDPQYGLRSRFCGGGPGRG